MKLWQCRDIWPASVFIKKYIYDFHLNFRLKGLKINNPKLKAHKKSWILESDLKHDAHTEFPFWYIDRVDVLTWFFSDKNQVDHKITKKLVFVSHSGQTSSHQLSASAAQVPCTTTATKGKIDVALRLAAIKDFNIVVTTNGS